LGVRDLEQKLAELVAGEEAIECLGRVLQTFHDGLVML